jgi:repressor LexA
LYRVPLVNKVAAGYPCGFTDLDYPARVADSYLSCPGLNDPDAFAATVIGESMMPDYLEGDIVVFSPSAEVTEGSDCFVRLEPDHETTFKRVFFSEQGAVVRLQPLNQKFPPVVRTREQLAGLYRAVWRYSKL